LISGASSSGSASGRSSVGPIMPGSFPGCGEGGGEGVRTERTSVNMLFEVDQSLPTTSMQIRLADGTRYVFVLFNFIRLHFVFCALKKK
jgi:UBX domain-containing protein 1